MIFNSNSTRGQTRFLTCVARVTCLVVLIRSLLTQLSENETRDNNIMDLIITNIQHLINIVETLPGISDHHSILTSINTVATMIENKPRHISLSIRTNTMGSLEHFF